MMAFAELEQHLIDLGIAPIDGELEPIPEAVWRGIEEEAGGEFPAVVRWWFGRFGGSWFPEGDVNYTDPRVGETTVAMLLNGDELREAYEYTREAVPADVVPFSDDGAGNRLCVGIGDGNRGVVYFHIHDAFLDRAFYVVADDFERFLRSWHREAPST